MRNLKIGIGSDHAGFAFKEAIKGKLQAEGHEVIDVGTQDERPVATAPYAQAVAEGLLDGKFERGILICGTGGGMSVSANRYPGIRAVLCFSPFTAEAARSHNDANILVLGSRTISLVQALELVDIFLSTPFAGGKYAERLKYLEAIERKVGEIVQEQSSGGKN
ncbi:MAG TPA: ribose 5-phosphate isomerase B [Candidatus Atribacteria bacterium]|nr:ribose 5-phosphate isomerase B [Candidatus Atribacteria bacterium]HPU08619.1 ribose 5-phosphate isomerase B [Candidatus Atribacteria bacterium]HPZ81632.1 ribose 5-phosphate isomerase B [Candidatus Atribacteria bacterium]